MSHPHSFLDFLQLFSDIYFFRGTLELVTAQKYSHRILISLSSLKLFSNLRSTFNKTELAGLQPGVFASLWVFWLSSAAPCRGVTGQRCLCQWPKAFPRGPPHQPMIPRLLEKTDSYTSLV